MVNKIGVMQGRLSAPRDGKIQSFPMKTWQEEFALAAQCGLDLIEWIFEAADWENNPLMTDPGIAEIRRHATQHKVGVASVCADYFMDLPLLRASEREKQERLAMLRRVITQCAKAQIQYLVIPFVDHSEIASPQELDEAARDMKSCALLAQTEGVTLCLETSLGPHEFRSLLKKVDDPRVRVNYDIGNSASLGYNVREEFKTYGPWIATIHVKDRKRAGGTVPLGNGDADIPAVFSECAAMKYAGPFILQAARQGDEVDTVKHYARYVRSCIEQVHYE